MDSTQLSNSGDDATRLARILDEIRSRRASGESYSDDAALKAHPDLAPQLAGELRKLEMIQRARRLAGLPGPHASEVADVAARVAPDSIPGYEILNEVHRGSQGVVYRAIQRSTRREVAIKIMKHGPFADSYDRVRFEREVHVLSALKHPNIVSIQDSGVAAGHSYFVMNYIDGEPLDAFVEHERYGIDAILQLFIKICDAVSAAQICGVIHRDLKPGNIRIDRGGEPHVLDFGLAKIDPTTAIRAATGDTAAAGASPDGRAKHHPENFTQTGQFVGSLPWASPEQSDGLGGNVDVRTDVYSLGVVLYQALTGRFPYPVVGNLRSVLDNIQTAPPVPPSALRREINDEVETIVLKCLQKERERRYQSAAELSHDLQRYLRGDAIDAKRDSRLYVLRKRLRRHRISVLATAAVFISLIAGIIATTRVTWRALHAEADALALAYAESRLREKADWETYKACLAAADAALTANNTAMAKARLDAAPSALRGWEWRYLSARLDQSLATYPIAGHLAARFAMSPDHRSAFMPLSDGRLIVLDPFTGESRELATRSTADVTTLAMSPNGDRFALGIRNGEVRLCRSTDGQEIHRFQAHVGGPVTALSFSPNGAALATGGGTTTGADFIRIWDSESGESRAVLGPLSASVNSVAFGAGGRVLASAHTKPSAGFRLWDVQAGHELRAVDYQGLDAYQLEFSPDGDRLAVASQDSLIRLYDADGNEQRALSGHTAGIFHVAFSTDGARLASASFDQTVRVWDLTTGATVACRRGHLNPVYQAEFLAGDDRLLSTSFAEPSLKVWDAGSNEEPRTFETGKYFVLLVAFSTDGRRLFTHQRCWDTTTGQLLSRVAPRSGWDVNSWIGPDQSFEWATNAPRAPAAALLRNGAPVVQTTDPVIFRPVASPDHQRVAIAFKSGVLQIFRADDGKLLAEFSIDPSLVTGVAFSRDGQSVVTWNSDARWTIWNVETGREKFTCSHGSDELVNAAFSHDGSLLATASYDGAARIWNAATGSELHVLRPTGAPVGDQSVVWSVAFSPDGARLATGSKDRRIRLWDVATGQELIALAGHAGTVMCLAWSPDGTQLASGGFEGNVCLWDSLSRAERNGRAK